ncbi:MAG: pentapeptide repeat-containing protein [Cellulosilyticaceae bacterium]
MIVSKRENNQINYRNKTKTNTDFIDKDLRRSNCYNCDFTSSNFNHASFRGAQFKNCNFTECTFEGTEIIAANLKNSVFKQVKFKNTIFDNVNLQGADFEGAQFENVIFVATDMTTAMNLDLSNQTVKIFEEMPTPEISKELEKAFKGAMTNDYIKFARVLDTKDGKINPISMMVLEKEFDEETLIKGLKILKKKVDGNFATLDYIIQALKSYKIEELI